MPPWACLPPECAVKNSRWRQVPGLAGQQKDAKFKEPKALHHKFLRTILVSFDFIKRKERAKFKEPTAQHHKFLRSILVSFVPRKALPVVRHCVTQSSKPLEYGLYNMGCPYACKMEGDPPRSPTVANPHAYGSLGRRPVIWFIPYLAVP